MLFEKYTLRSRLRRGYVVGTAIVEILAAKGAGAAISALGKTKAGAEFLTRIKNLASISKLKIAEAFSDNAAALAKQRLFKIFPVSGQPLGVLAGAPLSVKVIADFTVLTGNKISKGVTSFRQIVKEMASDFGEAVKPHLKELAQSYREAMKKAGLRADENEIITIFKEWEIERAKNINDSIKISDVSEITGKGYVDRQALRQKIGQADFPDYDNKHTKAKTIDEAERFSLKEAQFLPQLKGNIKAIYREAIENAVSNGLFKKVDGSWYFLHKFEKPVGFYNGKKVDWIRVELTDSKSPSIHGHPISLEKVRTYFPEVKGAK